MPRSSSLFICKGKGTSCSRNTSFGSTDLRNLIYSNYNADEILKNEEEGLEDEEYHEEEIKDEETLDSVQQEIDDTPVPQLTPFSLLWSFGQNTNMPFLNLTRAGVPVICYTSGHAICMYNVTTKEMKLMQGHGHLITSISSDALGRWVASCDIGERGVVVVWDTSSYLPVRTIFDPHPDFGARVVGLSHCAKYIVTVGNEHKQVVKMWKWTVGNDEAEDSQEIEGNVSRAVAICFNPDKPEYFMITLEHGMIFGTWDLEEEKLVLFKPLPFWKPSHAELVESTYVPGTDMAFTCTRNGVVYKWCAEKTAEPEETEVTNEKYCRNRYQLEECGINSICYVDGVIVTGSDHGHVKFYDKDLKILYWIQKCQLDPVRSVRFNIKPRKFVIKDPTKFSDDGSEWLSNTTSSPRMKHHAPDSPASTSLDSANNNSVSSGPSEELEEYYHTQIPDDATLQNRPFIVRDFIVYTKTGLFEVVDLVESKCVRVSPTCTSPLTSIDLHPEKQHLCVGNMLAELRLIHYVEHTVLVGVTMPVEMYYTDPDAFPSADNEHKLAAISYIKYCPFGLVLACGMTSGTLWLLDPTLLTPKDTRPHKRSKFKITGIEFSKDAKFLANIDEGYTVILYRMADGKYNFAGKYRSHYRPITTLLFGTPRKDATNPRLLTIGEDREMVEYDLETSDLEILKTERIDQSAAPTCATWYRTPEDDMLIVFDDKYKYKLINDTTGMNFGTYMGPTFGSPIKRMIMLEDGSGKMPEYLIFGTDVHIGIQKLPPDGNPYRNIGMVGHSTELQQMVISADGQYLFTMGENDPAVMMWKINTRSADVMHKLGGEGLDPYFGMLDGGEQGWLYREMQDMFYYTQILFQGHNSDEPRNVSHKIPVSELPDLMRAVGLYMSDYEVENITSEIKYSILQVDKQDESAPVAEEVTFEQFVKLYVNHRPAFGLTINEIEKNFAIFADDDLSEDPLISKAAFLEGMCDKGEMLGMELTKRYLKELTGNKETDTMHQASNQSVNTVHSESSKTSTLDSSEQRAVNLTHFDFIPEDISCSHFIENILGIETDAENLEAFMDTIRQTQYVEPVYEDEIKVKPSQSDLQDSDSASSTYTPM